MGEKHGPDQDHHVHQDYRIEMQKVAKDTWGDECRDGGTILVHDPEEARKIVEFLRSIGFAVLLERRTKAILQEDEFPEEEDDKHGP